MDLQRFINKVKLFGFEILGRYYSTYRGFVVSNEDPENNGRILVIVPSIFGSQAPPQWAYSKDRPSGPNYGLQWLPRTGDMIFIEFEFGDPKFPVWSHSHFLENEVPEEFKNTNDIGIKTPAGHIILVKEDENIIYVKHKDGNTFEIREDAIYMNGGENKGLIKIERLVERLNNLENWVKGFKTTFNSHVHPTTSPGVPTATTQTLIINTPATTSVGDLENEKVKH